MSVFNRRFQKDKYIGVMYLTSAPFPGGALYGLRNIVRQLDHQRFRPVVVLPEEHQELASFFNGMDVELATVRSRSLNRWTPLVVFDLGRTIWDLVKLVKRYNVHILHSTSPRAAVLGPLVRLLTGVKFVWQIAMLGQPRYLHFLAWFPDRVTTVSRAVFDEFGARSNMQVIYNGPWTENLSPDELEGRRRALRAELGIAENALIVGSIANLQYWKGIHVILEAFVRVAKKIPEAILVHLGGPVLGYERYAAEVESLIQRLGILDRTYRLGFRENAFHFYPLFDVFVHTPVLEGKHRTTEAFGHSVAEAMAYRLPVIASRCGGPAEIVEEGVTGELIEPGNVEELAEKISGLLQDPERRRRMGEAGYVRKRQYFTIEREARDYERIYLDLLSGHRKERRVLKNLSIGSVGGFRAHWQRVLSDDHFLENKQLTEVGLSSFVKILARLFQTPETKPIRVLEVGAGSATASRLLSEHFSGTFYALDILPEAIAVATRAVGEGRRPLLHLIVADLCRVPFAPESFDLVFSQGLVEHFEDPTEIITAQTQLLRANGLLVVSVPQKYNLYTLYKRWRLYKGQWSPGWETQYTVDQLIRMGRRFGLEVHDLDGHGSFLRMIAVLLLRGVLSTAALIGVIRVFDACDRLFGKRLRARLSQNVAVCFRKYNHTEGVMGTEFKP